MNYYLKALKNYAVFSGRASRTEFWMFYLFHIIFSFLLGFIAGILSVITKTDQSVLVNIYSLAMLTPTIAVSCRRMHDTDHSGWWQIAPIINIVLLIREGTKGDNKFGSDPCGRSQYKVPTSTITNLKSKGQSLQYRSVAKVKERPTFVIVELTENMVNKLFCLNPILSKGKVTFSQTSNFGTAQVMYAGNSFTAKASNKSSILFEGRGFYIDSDIFNNRVESFTNALKNGGLNIFNLMDGKSSDVYGFVSPSNFGNQNLVDVHGVTLLTTLDKSKSNSEQIIARSLVQDNSNELLAAILINNFGEGILEDLSNKVDVMKNYKLCALQGKYGSYLRQLELSKTLSFGNSENKSNTSELKILLEDNRLAQEVSTAFNNSKGNLGELLNSYIDKVVGKIYDPSKEITVNAFDSTDVRRVTQIIFAIDIFGQLKSQSNNILFPSNWTLKTKNLDGTYKSEFLTPQGLSVDNLTEVLVMMGAIERDAFRGLSYQEKARKIYTIDTLLTKGHGFALATSQCYLS
jgi:uncharacterized membrane protein YhaH (DUF805 family)